MVPDLETCLRAMGSRDTRFDGWFFVAVTTTGIYCRPSCPATAPRRENVRIYPTAAGAQAAGFRACLRCRPDAAPGSPQWNLRADVAGRAMRLIADGVVDREGVEGLARRLAYSPRHLRRLLVEQLGASPLDLPEPSGPRPPPADRDDRSALQRRRFRRRLCQPAAVQRHRPGDLRPHADGDPAAGGEAPAGRRLPARRLAAQPPRHRPPRPSSALSFCACRGASPSTAPPCCDSWPRAPFPASRRSWAAPTGVPCACPTATASPS